MTDNKRNRFTYTKYDNIELLEPPCLTCIHQVNHTPLFCEKYKIHKPNKVLLCEKECNYYDPFS